jgi:hypothetical protein
VSLAASLERFAERAGDPVALVHAEMVRRWPDSEALFVMDRGFQVRGQMLAVAFEALLDGEGRLAGLIGIERLNHLNIGVDPAMFDGFLPMLRDLVRQTLGAEWTAAMAAEWEARLRSVS